MYTCPVTNETFNPRHPDHIFKDKKSFEKFIEQMDPMDEFVVVKKDIGWEPATVECPKCHNEFVKTHPATIYCENCRPKES